MIFVAAKQVHLPVAVAPRVRCHNYVWMAVLIVAPCMTDAQDYPSRPVRMIATFVAGGGADVYARRLARKLSDVFGQQVVVDNRGGASGIIGTEIAARAAPDGYTVMFVTPSHVINAVTRHDLPYDTLKDFAPISLFTEFPFFLVTHPSFAPQSVPELIALARAKPGQINYSSSGIGTAPFFAAEMLKVYAKVDIVHVGYKGVPQAIADAMAGAVQLTFQGPTIMPSVKAGKLRALAVTSATRSAVWPDLPTIQEGGVARYHYTTWHGLLAPRNTPARIVARLNQAVVQAVRDQEVVSALVADGAQLHGSTADQFQNRLREEIAKYQELVREIGTVKFN